MTTVQDRITNVTLLLDTLKTQLAAGKAKLATTNTKAMEVNFQLQSCRKRQAEVPPPYIAPGRVLPRQVSAHEVEQSPPRPPGGYDLNTCSSIIVDWRGSGYIDKLESDSLVVDGVKMYMGVCTVKVFPKDRTYFLLSDRVAYQSYNYNGEAWVTKLTAVVS